MQGHGQAYLMPSYYLNERFYIVYNINLIMFYDLLIFIFMSYIKPQLIITTARCQLSYISYYYYIKPQHPILCLETSSSCISYYSYIKPQLRLFSSIYLLSCISYYSYIKPQRVYGSIGIIPVVYHTIPTSTHNSVDGVSVPIVLYIILFLHQTTTVGL